MEPELIHTVAVGYFDAGDRRTLMDHVWKAWLDTLHPSYQRWIKDTPSASLNLRYLWRDGKTKLVIPKSTWDELLSTVQEVPYKPDGILDVMHGVITELLAKESLKPQSAAFPATDA